jgi:hypothetical protein
MSRVIAVVLGGVLLTVPACAGGKRKTDTNFDNYPLLVKGIAKADKVVLYEGLPHQSMEHELQQKELQEKKTVEHHGFPFYAEPLDLKPDDAKKLITLFTDPGSFEQWRSTPACGGFHPDFLSEYHAGGDVYRLHVCLGCKEAKLFGPRVELYCAMTSEGYEAFRTLLKAYSKNRPNTSRLPWW